MVFRVAAKTSSGGKRRLVIVESPAKAKTIAGYLGEGYVVESSIGHIRDLPQQRRRGPGGAEAGVRDDRRRRRLRLRAALRRRPDKKQARRRPEAQAQGRRRALLATDEDREGEAIAWHLVQVLKPKVPVRRMVFHEITKDAIKRALDETRDDRRAARRRPGDAADPRPALRLRGLAGALAEGDAGPLGRPRAVGRDAPRRRARARADRASSRPAYWDIAGPFDPGPLQRAARRRRRPARRAGPRLRAATGR